MSGLKNLTYNYSGILNPKKMSGDVLRAYRSFHSQRKRCYCKTCPAYKNYGAKGIGVEYGIREYMGWYLYKIKNHVGNKPSIGRIDHSRSYSFENIEMIELSENAKESYSRHGNPAKHTRFEFYPLRESKEPFVSFLSIRAASRHLGIAQVTINKMVKGTNSGRYNFVLKPIA